MVRRTQVFGPAYLDRVVRVDAPLHHPEGADPIDQSLEGAWTFGDGLELVDGEGSRLEIEAPPGWPGPLGRIGLLGSIGDPSSPHGWKRTVKGVAWHDDLGGMGAGFAAALGGELVCALGSDDDPMSQAVARRLEGQGTIHRSIRVEGHPADWTLLVTSGPHGDKLGIGFRGCHAALETLGDAVGGSCDLRVVAGLPNGLCAEALSAPGAGVRLFAPAMRNMTDREVPVGRFVRHVDVLCCNRREWETLEDREQVAWQVAVLAVTDGPRGSVVRFTTPEGEAGRVEVPAFPRRRPPRDTNRAGEAFAAVLVGSLMDGGWSAGVVDSSRIREAAWRASAAAALVLDRAEFGFPAAAEIDAALRAGGAGG